MKKSILLISIMVISLHNAYAQPFTKLHDFLGTTTDGGNPQGNLYYDGSFLYGMTVNGGLNNNGIIFKIKKDGTLFSDMFDFSDATTGKFPHGSLISDGTYLYGLTQYGGAFSSGTAFKILPSGSGYVKLYDFDGTTNGKAPFGSFLLTGGDIYGMPQIGGSNSLGIIFKINTSTNVYTKLLDFTGVSGAAPSGEPEATLITDGTYLYGMGYNGAANNKGSVFKVKPDGSMFTNIATLTGTTAPANGSYPTQSLVSDGTYLYGMTESGGTNDLGTIFKINISTNVYTKLMDFTGANGSVPHGGLLYDGTYLYGAASGGGANGTGILFKILPNGTGFVDLFDFASGTAIATGKAPRGDLWSDGCYLYGMTVTGGASNLGTIFRFQYGTAPSLPGAVSGNPFVCNVSVQNYSIAPVAGATSYTWSLPGGWTGSSATNTLSAIAGTSGTFSVTATNACATTSASVLNVTVNPLPVISAVSSTSLLCIGQTATLTSSGANTYTWSPGGAGTSIIVSPTVTSTYTINGTDVNGCTNVATISQNVSLCSGVNELQDVTGRLSIYPNPNNGKFVIKADMQFGQGGIDGYDVTIYNPIGQLVLDIPHNRSDLNVDLSKYPKGIYNIVYRVNDNYKTVKIVVE